MSAMAPPGPGSGTGGGRSVRTGRGAARRPVGESIFRVGLALALAFGGLAAGAGYWQVIEAAPLSGRPDNPAVVVAARNAVRGEITDRYGTWLARNERDDRGTYRVYRDNTFSPVIGYATRQFGSAGLENAYDAELVGLKRPDPVADLLKKFSDDPYDPQSLELTLSRPLQRAAVEALGDFRGAVVMLDPRTGEVLVLASRPIFDANAVANPATSAEAFAQLRADEERRPLLPRATQGRYVPGSVFKIVTAIAGLESGAVTPETTFEEQPEAEEDGLLVSGFRIRDGHHRATGDQELDFVEATEVSCNIWYALAGLRTGGEDLVEVAKRLGFHERIPFDLPTAVSQVTNAEGSEPGGFKDDVELANAAYGQAETVVTPLQMALVASAVANDGVLMRPHVVRSLTGEGGTRAIEPQTWRRVAATQNARSIQEAMRQAVEGELGRQFTTGAKVRGVETAGKSGTAQLGGTGEPHSWFIGFAPVEDPQVAIAVIVEQGGRGGERASPIAGRMMTLALQELAGG